MRLRPSLMLICFLAATAGAQADPSVKRIEEGAREALSRTEANYRPPNSRLAIDYGGWLNFRYIDYNQDDNDPALRDEIDYRFWQDSRLWAKVNFDPDSSGLKNTHSLYVRIKNLYSVSRPNETAGSSDNDGVHLDYAYLELDLQPVWVKAGRQYFSVGQGIAYSDVGDGLQFTLERHKLSLKTFFSQSLPREDNIDTSAPGYDKHSRRQFFGAEASYKPTENQSFYAFTVIQRDKSKEYPDDPEHDFKYDSEYYGMGLRGTLLRPVSYWWGVILEKGKSYIYETNERKDVLAWANVLAISYEPAVYSHPNFYFKYAYGSGDKDRVNVTNTEDGNSFGKDRNFLYFGFIPTGYALSPQLSNLQFLKGGFTFKPFEKNRFLKGLSLGLDYYRYFKAVPSGGIYDEEASEESFDVGHEVDLTVDWQVFSDLNLSFEYRIQLICLHIQLDLLI